MSPGFGLVFLVLAKRLARLPAPLGSSVGREFDAHAPDMSSQAFSM